MSKHSTSFNLEVVRYMEASEKGSQLVADQFSLDRGTVCKWRAAYPEHGVDGLKPRYRQYSIDFKLDVLNYLTDHSQREAASHFNITSVSTILTWHRLFQAGGVAAL